MIFFSRREELELIRGIWQGSWRNLVSYSLPLTNSEQRKIREPDDVQICPLSCSPAFFSYLAQMLPVSTFLLSLVVAAFLFIFHDPGLWDLSCKQTKTHIFFLFCKREKTHIWNNNSVLTGSDYTIKVSSSFFSSYATEFQFTRPNISVLLLSINEAIICNSIIVISFPTEQTFTDFLD